MKRSIFILDMICLILLFHFFFEGIYKLQDLTLLRLWMRALPPNWWKWADVLTWLVPIYELLIGIFLAFRKTRLPTLYVIFIVQLVYVIYLIWAFNYFIVVVRPYHIYWHEPTWLQVTAFNLLVAGVAVAGIAILENRLSKTNSVNILRKQEPANVH